MNISLQQLAYLSEILFGTGFLVVLWKINRAINKTLDLLDEYPLHRHIGDAIIYPRGKRPSDEDTTHSHIRGRGRRASDSLGVLLFILLACHSSQPQATATTPQSASSSVFLLTGVSTPQASPDLINIQQTVHLLFYSSPASGAPTGVQIRIEGSFDGALYFPISDDGTDPGANGNLLIAVGAYPHVRVNLVNCAGCNSSNKITATYIGTSSMPGAAFGLYGAGQQVRKVLFISASTGVTASTAAVNTPYGSAGGYIVVNASAAFAAGGGSITVKDQDFSGATTITTFALPTSGTQFVIPVAPTPSASVVVTYTKGANSSHTFSAFYYFSAGGPGQPGNSANAEATALAGTASITLTPNAFQRGHVYAVSARCSAGSAQILVVDTTASINLWSSASTEVGTTTLQPQHWNPGLAGAPGDTIAVQLTTCGGGNTGTLDVQGSVF